MHLVLRERVHQVLHALARVFRVAAVRKAVHELAESVEGLLCGLRVAFGKILVRQAGEQAEVLVEGRKALQVVHVVRVGMVGVQLDEAVRRRDGKGRLVRLVVRVRDLDLRLLRVATVREARLELLEELDGLLVGTLGHVVLRFGVQLLGIPARRLVDLFRQQAASAEQQCTDNR